jgi:hypothetical protein
MIDTLKKQNPWQQQRSRQFGNRSAIGLLDIAGIHFIITHVYYLGYRVLGARLKALGNYL